jgi:hypothetical protein
MQAPDECTTDHDRAQPITIDPDETANQAPRHSAGTRRIAQIPAQLLVQQAASLQRFALGSDAALPIRPRSSSHSPASEQVNAPLNLAAPGKQCTDASVARLHNLSSSLVQILRLNGRASAIDYLAIGDCPSDFDLD